MEQHQQLNNSLVQVLCSQGGMVSGTPCWGYTQHSGQHEFSYGAAIPPWVDSTQPSGAVGEPMFIVVSDQPELDMDLNLTMGDSSGIVMHSNCHIIQL